MSKQYTYDNKFDRNVVSITDSEETDSLFPGVRGSGFQTKDGVMYGFFKDDEEVIVEYRKKQQSGITEQDLVDKLSGYFKLKLKQGYKPYEDKVSVKNSLFMRKRLGNWFGELSEYFGK